MEPASLKAGINASARSFIRLPGWFTKRRRRRHAPVVLDIPEVVEQIPLFAVRADNFLQRAGNLPRNVRNRIALPVRPNRFAEHIRKRLAFHPHHEHRSDRRTGGQR